MTDFPTRHFSEYDNESAVMARLKGFLAYVSRHVDQAPEDQRLRLLVFLEEWVFADRREHCRKPCSFRVTCGTAGLVFADFVKNISIGGAFIQSRAPLSVGEEISLTFPFPGHEEPTEMMGRVVWKSAVGVGVKFIEVSRRVRGFIESL
jgi:Tfp pilus assembly protein PilZ